MKFLRRPAVLLVLSGVVVHACVLGVVHIRTGGIDSYAFESLDAREYWQIARNLRYHGAFSQDETPPFTPDTWRTPGYPLVLAIVMTVTGDSPVSLIIFQQVLSIFSVWVLFCAVRPWMSDGRAVVVAIVFLLEPYHLLYSLWLLATTLFVTVLLLTWLAWQKTLATGRLRWVIASGGLCGFLVLVRPIAALIPVLLLLGLVVLAVRRGKTSMVPRVHAVSSSRAMMFAVMGLLVVGSWMLRNLQSAGHFALSDQGGVVLAYFKAAEVELWRQGRGADRIKETSLDAREADDPHPVWERIDERLRSRMTDLPPDVRATLHWRNLAQGNKTKADSFEVSDALREIAVSDLTAAPLSTLSCYLVRCGSILTFPLNLAMSPPTGRDGSRLKWGLQSIPYVVLAVWVIGVLFRNRPPFVQVYFPIACIVGLLLATTPQLDPRFRVPMVPFLLFLALLPPRFKSEAVLADSRIHGPNEKGA